MRYIIFVLFFMTSFVYCQTNNDNILIKTFPTGLYGSNCYVVSQNGTGFMVDAGAGDFDIIKYINENNIEIQYIFCTHSHIDHVLFAMDNKELTHAKIALHTDDINHYKYYTSAKIKELIANGDVKNEDLPFIEKFKQIKYDTLLNGNEVFNICDMKVEILSTPGHSKGSICILINCKYLFTGDTIYYDSMGNWDIDTGNYDDIMNSLHKIFKLDGNILIYQGHGDSIRLKDIKEKLKM